MSNTAYEMWFESRELSTSTAHAQRYQRAEEEWMIVVPVVDAEGVATGLYDVFTSSGSRYHVDLRSRGACDCPDTVHRDPIACKHWIRVLLLIARTDMPAEGEPVPEMVVEILADLVTVFSENDEMAESAIGRTGDDIQPFVDAVAQLEVC